MDREDVRILGYCEECGIEITDDFEEYYCDENEHNYRYVNQQPNRGNSGESTVGGSTTNE